MRLVVPEEVYERARAEIIGTLMNDLVWSLPKTEDACIRLLDWLSCRDDTPEPLVDTDIRAGFALMVCRVLDSSFFGLPKPAQVVDRIHYFQLQARGATTTGTPLSRAS